MKKHIFKIVSLLMLMFITSNIYGQSNQKVNISKLENPYPGYLLFDFPDVTLLSSLDNYGYFVNQNYSGWASQGVYKLKNGQIAKIGDDEYYIYNESLQLIDSIPNPTQFMIDYHEFISLSNGNYLMIVNEFRTIDMSQFTQGGKTNAQVINNIIVETDRDGKIYWSWSSLDHLNIIDATSDIDLTQNLIDYAHINAMVEDDNGNILISIRHFDEISLIEKSTGNFLWRFGGSHCVNNEYTIVGDTQNGFTGFSHQHTPVILQNGNILLFDNGNMRSSPFSRAVEYSMNHSSKKATKVWEYRKTPDVYCRSMGSVERLPNGNTLINWSLNSITEVRNDKTVALEIDQLIKNPIYRVNKVYNKMTFASNQLTNNGDYTFSGNNGETDVKINITSLSSNSVAYVQKHLYPPYKDTYNDNEVKSLLPYRWVFTPDKGSATVAGTIKINISQLSNIQNPNKLAIYKRDKEGTGNFQMLNTTFNSGTNELSASFNGWGEFVISNFELKKPTLVLPENSIYSSVDLDLSWSSVQGSTSYKVELSKYVNFSSIELAKNVTTNKFTATNLSYNTKYYWRVKAINAFDESDWSSINNFSTITEPAKLKFPLDNSFGFRFKDSIIWNKVEGATKYHLQVSIDSNFISLSINDFNVSNNYYLPFALANNTKYYWRVKSLNNPSIGIWSDVFSFTSEIATPQTFNPPNFSINNEIKQNFKWQNIQEAEFYIFELAFDNKFDNVFKRFSNLIKNELMINDLEYGKDYFWRVKAARKIDTSEWSVMMQFSTLFEKAILISPVNKSIDVVVNPLLKWSSNAQEVNYKLQISTDADFSKIELQIDELTDNFYQIDELKPSTQFFWRVMAYDEEKISNWSETYSFTSKNSLGLQSPKLQYPKDLSDVFSDVKMVWKKSLNAKSYKLQIASDSEFAKVIYDFNNLDEASFSIKGLKENQSYYWRVKSLSKYDSSAWSETYQFNVIKGVRLVRLISPTNDELMVSTYGNLSWESYDEAESYTISLAENENFNNPIIFEEVKDTNFKYSNLQMNTTYFWRVRYSKMGYTSDWSETWTFTSKPQKILNKPIIQGIENGSTEIPISGFIRWDEVENASSYSISISVDSDFSSHVLRIENLKENEFAYSDFNYSTSYYVRVSAKNENSHSNWSDVTEFTTELKAPSINSPINGEDNLEVNGIITWTNDENDYWYHLQISKVENFDQLTLDINKFEENQFNYSLEDNTIYYCRVKTYNDTNSSKWSIPISFKTKNPTSVLDLIENNLMVYPNPAKDILNIKYKNENVTSNLIITDLLGNEYLYNENIKSINNQIDISNLPAGTYIIRIGKITKFFIKN